MAQYLQSSFCINLMYKVWAVFDMYGIHDTTHRAYMTCKIPNHSTYHPILWAIYQITFWDLIVASDF